MMNVPKPERNPSTHKAHRREVGWQIVFPLTCGSIILLGLAIWTVVGTVQGGNVSQPADTSLIFLLIPTMILALIPLALLAGLAYGIIAFNKMLPQYFFKAQGALRKVQDGVRIGADKLVEPVIRIESMIAALGVLKRKK